MNQEKHDLVSVIIPAYNAGKIIAETIESVLSQTHQNLELIIVNDGSMDDTEDVIKPYTKDPRIRYLFQDKLGCSAAKNMGLHASTGSFIQYLDADDLLSSDKIAEQVGAIRTDPYAIAVCRTMTFYDRVDDKMNLEIDTEFLYSTDDNFEFILNLYGLNGKNGMIQPNAFLISRKLADKIGPYDVSISPSPDEDGEYFCRAMLAAEKICFTTNGINYYRKQPDSRTSLSKQFSHFHAKGALRSLQLITNHLLARENSERVKKIVADYYAGFMYQYSKFPDLVKKAEAEIYNMGLKKIPVSGSKNFKKVSNIVGLHNAILFKNLASSLRNPAS